MIHLQTMAPNEQRYVSFDGMQILRIRSSGTVMESDPLARMVHGYPSIPGYITL
jgi:hypothetical protein